MAEESRQRVEESRLDASKQTLENSKQILGESRQWLEELKQNPDGTYVDMLKYAGVKSLEKTQSMNSQATISKTCILSMWSG